MRDNIKTVEIRQRPVRLANGSGLKGHVSIELRDGLTGKLQEKTEADNMITAAYDKLINYAMSRAYGMNPWGNAYVYETRPEGGHPILYSKGPDGRAGTTDDVLPDQDTFEEPFRDTSWTNGWAPYRLRGIVVAPDEETKRRVQEEMKEYDRK